MPRSSSREPAKYSGTRIFSTERRRTQNRQAQKKYRDRQKERLKYLEDRVKILEEENARLREHSGYNATESSYSSNTTVYDSDLNSSSGAILSHGVLPLPSNESYQIPNYEQQAYGHIDSAASEPCTSAILLKSALNNIPSSLSPADGDKYSIMYIPISGPTSIMPSSLKEIKQD